MKRFLHLLAAIGILCACIQRKPADPVKKELGTKKTEPARTEPAVEIERVLCNKLHFRFHVIQKTNGTWIVVRPNGWRENWASRYSLEDLKEIYDVQDCAGLPSIPSPEIE